MNKNYLSPLTTDDFKALERRGFTIDGGYLIAKGGFGAVYKGKHYDENIAVKSMHMDPEASRGSVCDKITEMFILKKFSCHQSMVKVIGFYFTSSSHLLIFMELLNCSLRDQLNKMKRDPFSKTIVHKIFCEIGSALLYMHDSGFAHRDLKPENILLKISENTNEMSAKLTDFGLSSMCYSLEDGKPTTISDCKGTMIYMAYEVLKIYVRIKQKVPSYTSSTYCPFLADVFSMGIILYEMLHGYRKYPVKIGSQATGAEVLALWKEANGIYEYDSKLNKDAVILLDMMLQINPNYRYTMRQVMEHDWVITSKTYSQTYLFEAQF